jgi:hypothetical protein
VGKHPTDTCVRVDGQDSKIVARLVVHVLGKLELDVPLGWRARRREDAVVRDGAEGDIRLPERRRTRCACVHELHGKADRLGFSCAVFLNVA